MPLTLKPAAPNHVHQDDTLATRSLTKNPGELTKDAHLKKVAVRVVRLEPKKLEKDDEWIGCVSSGV